MDKELFRRLRLLYAEIPYASNIEAMWWIRGMGIQAGMPQGVYKVGDKFASIVYLEDVDCWEAHLDGGRERQFHTFEEARCFIGFASSTRSPNSLTIERLRDDAILNHRNIP